ncbi:SDR family NAD(P)-dependent oxidoreductase [Alkalispirochaeta americana]|nr:SDR family NAD(P)-dependent oxidoreductase [Alkalispirochaeta americana]
MGLLTRADARSIRLADKVALVVGGSGGIGRAVALTLADEGARMIIHGGRSQERLERVVRYINHRGGRCRGFLLPLAEADDILPLIDQAGEVDILVVAFGPVEYRPLAGTDPASWRRMTELNLVLPGLLLSHYLPKMIERGWGRVILFGGPRADRLCGFRESAAYSAAKAGVASLVKSAALQTGGRNISVNLISPGYVDTEYLTPQDRHQQQQRSPRGRLIPPERVARVVRHLICADEADVNGAVITVDQGLG